MFNVTVLRLKHSVTEVNITALLSEQLKRETVTTLDASEDVKKLSRMLLVGL